MFFYLKKLFQSWFQKEVYLDHASTTPMDPRVFSVMKKVINHSYGNQGGFYNLGTETAKTISESRKKVASLLATTSEHLLFTRGGTEANNIAILGTISHFNKINPGVIPHIITSVIEHDSVLETCRHLESEGKAVVSYVSCGADGVIDVSEIKKELRLETVLVTVMYANNEIGTIQPIKDIAKLIRWYKKQLKENNTVVISSEYPLVHTDAIQAINYCDINVARLGIDMMTLSGSKIYGPKSIGALFVKNKELLDPVIFGGGQEFGLRSGTEDSAMIAGFAKALEISQEVKDHEVKRLVTIREDVIVELLKDDRITLNGSESDRLPNNINVSVSGFSGEELVIKLAAHGFAVSSKSACQSDSDEESHVIAALREAQGISSKSEEGSLRITMGRGTDRNDMDKFIKVLKKLLK